MKTKNYVHTFKKEGYLQFYDVIATIIQFNYQIIIFKRSKKKIQTLEYSLNTFIIDFILPSITDNHF